ncbi:carbohydrate ABC transporter permease [Metabacillus idriensis]|uniref:carbohydrate ABC transporter permease n=1 Tax=Metabacillus idriensis TaxID=324768 RepID=UPI00163B53B0|nr:sugar ABC transporter permease [Metabacillus idriensis]QNG59359.1 sugar ABC transporter permease [Bacillus sp. PAMC26568]
MNYPPTIKAETREVLSIHRKKKKWNKEAIAAYLFIAPVVLGLFAFYMMPAIASFYLSFTEWDGLTAPVFTGLENAVTLMQDETFLLSMRNTLFFTFVSVPLSIGLAVIVAVMLNQKIKGMVIYRTLYFLPVVTMPVAVGMVWKWLYNSEFGLINFVLGKLHLPQPEWLFDEKIALFSIILVSVWMGIGHNIVLLLAGLQGISASYYEAAKLDGASRLHQFFHITVPLLTPSIFFVFIMSMISALQMFDLIFIMVGSETSILDPMRTVVYGVWESGFKYFEMGYASAKAFILFIIILIITIIQMRLQNKWVHYDS